MTEPDPNAGTPAEPAAPEEPAAPPEPAAPADPAPTAAPAASGPNSGPLGEERGVGFAIVMWIVTLGIYGLYWLY